MHNLISHIFRSYYYYSFKTFVLYNQFDSLLFCMRFHKDGPGLCLKRELVIDMAHNEKVCPSGLNTAWLVFHTSTIRHPVISATWDQKHSFSVCRVPQRSLTCTKVSSNAVHQSMNSLPLQSGFYTVLSG